MKQPHYRISFARSSKDKKFDAFLNQMICDEKDFHKTFQEFEATFLQGYRRVERLSIGSSDNPCDRYIYNKDNDWDDRIYIYVYPPR